jgi:hypothetical protein
VTPRELRAALTTIGIRDRQRERRR